MWGYAKRKLSHRSWFQASAAMLMKSSVSWGIMQRRVVIVYQRFGTAYRSYHGSRVWTLDSWPVSMVPIRCPETSANNYHTTAHSVPEDRRFPLSQIFALFRNALREFSVYLPVIGMCSVRNSIYCNRDSHILKVFLCSLQLCNRTAPSLAPAHEFLWSCTKQQKSFLRNN
jgi:hypothetical protein